ncbi:MAG TPA: helix-turn-helix domain-containing protein [Stackebrandtia sp.]|uniref:helix-turn-helix domain-containing protein n=1 Tax=Stackebrandtia sp. TaxID=2023065 RepID=UPI002D5A1A7D|nr:helix-turn-helix domain-containing protein [Stackebrandtia sp.]HZE37456.1 helix-turn-helix domain-containing protein [Stackebrandtia sp.]
MDSLELLAHPVRLRIVHAMKGGRALTTSQICARMSDVSKATVYRQVGVLADAGVLEVESEQRVRGAVERRWRLRAELATIDPDQAAAASAGDHRRMFAAAMSTLTAEFNAYLTATDAVGPHVGYRQHAIWLSPAERDALIARMREAILPALGNPASPDRAAYLLSPILFPVEEPSWGDDPGH